MPFHAELRQSTAIMNLKIIFQDFSLVKSSAHIFPIVIFKHYSSSLAPFLQILHLAIFWISSFRCLLRSFNKMAVAQSPSSRLLKNYLKRSNSQISASRCLSVVGQHGSMLAQQSIAWGLLSLIRCPCYRDLFQLPHAVQDRLIPVYSYKIICAQKQPLSNLL